MSSTPLTRNAVFLQHAALPEHGRELLEQQGARQGPQPRAGSVAQDDWLQAHGRTRTVVYASGFRGFPISDRMPHFQKVRRARRRTHRSDRVRQAMTRRVALIIGVAGLEGAYLGNPKARRDNKAAVCDSLPAR